MILLHKKNHPFFSGLAAASKVVQSGYSSVSLCKINDRVIRPFSNHKLRPRKNLSSAGIFQTDHVTSMTDKPGPHLEHVALQAGVSLHLKHLPSGAVVVPEADMAIGCLDLKNP